MKPLLVLTGAAGTALAVRIVRSRHRRLLHPDGRSFTGTLEIWGLDEPLGAPLIDRPGAHPVTVRISKGAGTGPGRADVLGLAVRVAEPGTGERFDLLLSTVGAGRLLRHVPMPRRSFDTVYGTVVAFRTAAGHKVLLSAMPDPGGTALGHSLESVVATAARPGGARLLLAASVGSAVPLPFGRVTLEQPLPASVDAALAFDPVGNTTPGLHPSGFLHASRGIAYRLSQRLRGAEPDGTNRTEVVRAAMHR
jgi:hypothetical protein